MRACQRRAPAGRQRKQQDNRRPLHRSRHTADGRAGATGIARLGRKSLLQRLTTVAESVAAPGRSYGGCRQPCDWRFGRWPPRLIVPDTPADRGGPRQIPRGDTVSLSTILLILAFVAFVLAAVGWGYKKTNLLGMGLALWVLSILITQVHASKRPDDPQEH